MAQRINHHDPDHMGFVPRKYCGFCLNYGRKSSRTRPDVRAFAALKRKEKQLIV